MNQCPECDKGLSARAKRCSCGWFNAERQEPAITDHRCQYSISQQRCPLPGTTCPYTRANSVWFCIDHWQTLGNPKMAKEAMNNAEKNYQKILERRIDWRRKLFTFERDDYESKG